MPRPTRAAAPAPQKRTVTNWPASHNPRRVDVAGCAQYLSVSDRWVRRAVLEERVPYQHVGKHLRFDLDRLDAWLDENSFEPVGR